MYIFEDYICYYFPLSTFQERLRSPIEYRLTPPRFATSDVDYFFKQIMDPGTKFASLFQMCAFTELSHTHAEGSEFSVATISVFILFLSVSFCVITATSRVLDGAAAQGVLGLSLRSSHLSRFEAGCL